MNIMNKQNQCDGCKKGWPLSISTDKIHIGPGKYNLIGCTKDRYASFIQTVSEDLMIDGQKVEKGERYWIHKGIEISNVIYKVSSSSDWKKEFENGSFGHFPHKWRVFLIPFIENLIQAAREEGYKKWCAFPYAPAHEMDPFFDKLRQEGRAAEREEQNRINNSGRKLYQIGYTAALEEMKIEIEKLDFVVWSKSRKNGVRKSVMLDELLAALSDLKEKP